MSGYCEKCGETICVCASAQTRLTARLERLGKKTWTRSLSEEVIAVLWIIAAILSFGFHFDTMGWACTIKALMDTLTALWFALREAIDDKRSNA